MDMAIPTIAIVVAGARALMANARAEVLVAISTSDNMQKKNLSISCSKPRKK